MAHFEKGSHVFCCFLAVLSVEQNNSTAHFFCRVRVEKGRAGRIMRWKAR